MRKFVRQCWTTSQKITLVLLRKRAFTKRGGKPHVGSCEGLPVTNCSPTAIQLVLAPPTKIKILLTPSKRRNIVALFSWELKLRSIPTAASSHVSIRTFQGTELTGLPDRHKHVVNRQTPLIGAGTCSEVVYIPQLLQV